MAYNTNNPLGSSDPRDLFDNAGNFDQGMGSTEDTFLDRFGRQRYTWQAYHKLVIDAKAQIDPTVEAAQEAVNSTAAAAISQMEETAANLGDDLNNKHYLTYDQMAGDPQARDAVLAYVDADPTPALNGFYFWNSESSTWMRSIKQLVFKGQMDQRIDPIAEQQKRSRASLAPKVTITDRSSGPAIEVLPEGAEDAVVGKVGSTGKSAHRTDTKLEKFFDYFERVVGKRLTFSKGGVVSTVASFFHWDITGDLSFKGGKGTEVSVSGDGVRIGVGGVVGAEQNSAWRHRSGRLMSKLDHGLYTGDLSYIGSDFVAPNRPSDVPVVIPAASAPERVNRIIQGCPSVAVVGSRIWVAFFGGIQNNHESMYDFQVLKYSDDGGSTWVEWAYWVQNPAVARLSTVYLHLDDRGILWVFSGTDHVFSINPDDQLGCWAFTIKDPLSDKPTASSMWRTSSLGYPSYINPVDERLVMPLQIQESMTQIPDRKGVHLFEFDPTCRGLTRAGRLPLVGNTDWQESSVVQLKSGKLMAMYRTTSGQMACFSDTGELNTWGAPAPMSAFLGPNPGSRACLRRTPKGNLVLAYNAAISREHMTLALLNDEGSGLIHSKLLDTMETSYPDIAFDGAGNILVVWDRERAVERTVMLSIISEDDFVANGESAAQNIIVVDSKKDAP